MEKKISNILGIIESMQGLLTEFTKNNESDIVDLRFQITLARIRYELLSEQKELGTLTVSAIQQLCVFNEGLYRSQMPEFATLSGKLLLELKKFSPEMKSYKSSALGVKTVEWQKFYLTLDDENTKSKSLISRVLKVLF